MKQEQLFIDYIEQSIIQNWDRNALTDYQGITLQYKDVARKIAKFHIVLESAGIQPGDKIAVCGRNSAHWAVCFLATVTYGAVIVPILHEFKADNIHNIVNHSEAKLLFVGDRAWENLNEEAMPLLMGVVLLTDLPGCLPGRTAHGSFRTRVTPSTARAIPRTSVPNISATAKNSRPKSWRLSIIRPALPAIPKA
ncbi:MAG: AMP-binding protein [Bacteroides stercoris]